MSMNLVNGLEGSYLHTVQLNAEESFSRVDHFFSTLDRVLAKNDVKTAAQIAGRIKFNVQTIEQNKDGKQIHLLPVFHRRVVDCLNKNDTPAAAKMRQDLAEFYFRESLHYLALEESKERYSKPLAWLTAQEMESLGSSNHAQAYYFHATSRIDYLENILRTQKVEARQSRYYGAFVAAQAPEREYGSFVLALNKNIERISPLSSHNNEGTIAGFLKDIPVNSETLSYILLLENDNSRDSMKNFLHRRALAQGVTLDKTNPDQAREWLQMKCKEWAGREIKILWESEANPYMKKVRAGNLGVPKEWGSDCSDLRESDQPLISRSDFLPSRL